MTRVQTTVFPNCIKLEVIDAKPQAAYRLTVQGSQGLENHRIANGSLFLILPNVEKPIEMSIEEFDGSAISIVWHETVTIPSVLTTDAEQLKVTAEAAGITPAAFYNEQLVNAFVKRLATVQSEILDLQAQERSITHLLKGNGNTK